MDDLVAPLFVADGQTEPSLIDALPGVLRHSVDSAAVEAKRLGALGVPGVIIFSLPKPGDKDARGSAAARSGGITERALGAVRDGVADSVVVMADCCLDEFTDHGHCGVLDPATGSVDNDATLALYAELAVFQATSGAHVVAPSGMMDGQVAAIRTGLDSAGQAETAILAYAAKYASALYGPFREAASVAIAGGGDRKGYQQDPANRREAVAEVTLDVAEGADMVMVKPALSTLDVIADVRQVVEVPLAAYHVSGEYAMVKAAAERGWIDGPAVALEQITAVKRAGADFVLTYFAGELAELLGG